MPAGKNGDQMHVWPGVPKSLLFKPQTTGTYHFAVDSTGPADRGSYTLEVEDYAPPPHSTCAGALSVPLSATKTIITGDTCPVPNEFGYGVNCGKPGFLGQLFGGQLYYKLSLTAGKLYTFSFTPTFPYGWIYLFSGACTMAQINADCGSKGLSGDISPSVQEDQTTSMTFLPKTSGSYVLAVDNTVVFGSCGYYRIDIK